MSQLLYLDHENKAYCILACGLCVSWHELADLEYQQLHFTRLRSVPPGWTQRFRTQQHGGPAQLAIIVCIGTSSCRRRIVSASMHKLAEASRVLSVACGA